MDADLTKPCDHQKVSKNLACRRQVFRLSEYLIAIIRPPKLTFDYRGQALVSSVVSGRPEELSCKLSSVTLFGGHTACGCVHQKMTKNCRRARQLMRFFFFFVGLWETTRSSGYVMTRSHGIVSTWTIKYFVMPLEASTI